MAAKFDPSPLVAGAAGPEEAKPSDAGGAGPEEEGSAGPDSPWVRRCRDVVMVRDTSSNSNFFMLAIEEAKI